MKLVKNCLLEIFVIFLQFVMWFPIAIVRNIFLKILLKRYSLNSYVKRNVEFKKPRNISLDDNVYINKGVLLDGRGGNLIIGKSVDVAEGVFIYTLTHNINDNSHNAHGSDVVIEDHVWIGARSIILPGVTIGRGAVVGCGAVVTKNVAANEVVAGVPAKVIGHRVNSLEYALTGINFIL